MTSLTDYADKNIIKRENTKVNYETAAPEIYGRAEKGTQITKETPIIDEMTKRINALLGELEYSCSRLHTTAEKVSGPVPENESANSQPTSGGGCLLDELSKIISRVQTINSSINLAANRLQTALG